MNPAHTTDFNAWIDQTSQLLRQRRSDSWLDSITDACTQIALAIEDSPSLQPYSAEQ